MISDKPNSEHDAEVGLERILAELRARGQRITPQRVAIIRAFLARNDHPTADAIYQELRSAYPMMALSTVYATLELLTEVGEAVDVAPAAAQARFDPMTGEHCHLVCLKCSAIADLPVCPGAGDAEVTALMAQQGFQPAREMHQVFGVCARCRERPA
jgi:Fe2+ or Zn2+ uptake regulation protein